MSAEDGDGDKVGGAVGGPLVRRLARGFSGHPVAAVVVVALVVRLMVAVASFLATDGVLIPDEALYVDLGRAVVHGQSPDQWYPGYGQSFYDSTEAFSAPLILLFHVFGPSRLVGQVFAAAVGAAVAGATVGIGLRFLRPGFAVLAGLVVALTPSQVLFSSVVLREAHIWLGLTLVGLGAALLTDTALRRMAGGLALAVAGLLELALLRPQTLLAASWALALALLFTPRPWWLARVSAGMAAAAILPWIAGLGLGGVELVRSAAPRLSTTRATLAVGARSAFVPVVQAPARSRATAKPRGTSGRPVTSGQSSGRARPASAAVRRSRLPSQRVVARSEQRTDGRRAARGALSPAGRSTPATPVRAVSASGPSMAVRAAAAAGADASAPTGLRALPAGLVNVTIRPFPWQSTIGISLLMARLETLGWYVLYALSIVGVLASLRRRPVRWALQFPVTVLGMLVGIAALTQGNLGTAFRHRDQVLWVLALCAAAGLQWLLAESRLARRHAARRMGRAG